MKQELKKEFVATPDPQIGSNSLCPSVATESESESEATTQSALTSPESPTLDTPTPPFTSSTFRIAVFDLDGTVLNNGIMSDTVEDALHKLRDNGIQVVVATGRDISQIPSRVLKCFSYRITTNGSSVTDPKGNIILDHPLSHKIVHQTLKIIRSHHGSSCLYFNGMVVASPIFLIRILLGTNFASKSHRASTKEVRKGKNLVRFRLGRYLNKKRLDVYKIQSFFKSAHDAQDCATHLNDLGLVNPVINDARNMEITLQGITKASGLRQLCTLLNCPTSHVIAFGDSPNDLDILSAAGFSVAMGNAEAPVKAQVNYITDSVSNDGVATAIHTLFSL